MPVRTTDWLHYPDPVVHESLAESNSDTATLLGALAVAGSQLEASPMLVPPSAALQATLEPATRLLPPQTAFVDPDSVFGQWLGLATLAEHLEAPTLARLLIDALVAHLEAESRTVCTLASADPDAVEAEWLGICAARRGRLARIAGALDDATEWYRDAAQRTTRSVWRDARPLAHLGLCIVAASRGNFPDVLRRATRLLLVRPAIAPVHRIPAYQIRALALRKRGQHIDALLDAWAAYDLLQPEDVRRPELLLSMAEIAAEAGDFDAALQGFAGALRTVVPRRIEVSARVGQLRALTDAVAAGRDDARPALRTSFEIAQRMLRVALPPRDELRLLLAVLEAAPRVGDVADTDVWHERASVLAHDHGFFEQQFKLGTLRASAPPGTADAGAKDLGVRTASLGVETTTRGRDEGRRHPALQRLLQMI